MIRQLERAVSFIQILFLVAKKSLAKDQLQNTEPGKACTAECWLQFEWKSRSAAAPPLRDLLPEKFWEPPAPCEARSKAARHYHIYPC